MRARPPLEGLARRYRLGGWRFLRRPSREPMTKSREPFRSTKMRTEFKEAIYHITARGNCRKTKASFAEADVELASVRSGDLLERIEVELLLAEIDDRAVLPQNVHPQQADHFAATAVIKCEPPNAQIRRPHTDPCDPERAQVS